MVNPLKLKKEAIVMISPSLMNWSIIITNPTHVSDIAWHHANLLKPFFTFSPNKCSAEVLPSLDTSDHSLANVKNDAKLKAFSENVSTEVKWPECTAAIDQPNHNYHLYYRGKCSRIFATLKTLCNQFKRV